MPFSFDAPDNTIQTSAPHSRRQDMLKENGWQPIRKDRPPRFGLVSRVRISLHCGVNFRALEDLIQRRD